MRVAGVVAVIPAVRHAAADDQVIADLIVGPDAGVGERLTVLVHIRDETKEVVSLTDGVVADRRDEAANLDVQVVVGDFSVERGNGHAVELAVVPARFKTRRGVPAVVGPVQRINPPAQGRAAAFVVSRLAGVEIDFVELVIIRPVGPGQRTVEPVVGLVRIPDVALGHVAAGLDAAGREEAAIAQAVGFPQVFQQAPARPTATAAVVAAFAGGGHVAAGALDNSGRRHRLVARRAFGLADRVGKVIRARVPGRSLEFHGLGFG